MTAANELPPLTPPGGPAARVIGIDASLASTGVASIRWAPDEPTPITAEVEIIQTKGKRADTLLDRNRRLQTITNEVTQRLTMNTTLVVFEAGAFSRVGGSNWDRAGLWWRLVDLVWRWQVHGGAHIATVAPTSLKKWATDRGNADKSDVAVALARMWPDVDAPSNDGWDALGLAQMGAQHLGWPVPSRAHHAAARAKAAWPASLIAEEAS